MPFCEREGKKGSAGWLCAPVKRHHQSALPCSAMATICKEVPHADLSYIPLNLSSFK